MKHISNIIFIVVLGIVLYSRGPTWWNYYQNQGKQVPQLRYLDSQALPQTWMGAQPHQQLLVFWATWCAPCKVEIARLQKMVEEKSLDPKKVILVSVAEEKELVDQVLKERDYPFVNIFDAFNELNQFFKVQGTPTLVLLDKDGTVLWQTMGLSPTLAFRLRELK